MAEEPAMIPSFTHGYGFAVTMETDGVLFDVAEERSRQERKWGTQDHDPAMWMTVLGEEYGEACKDALDSRLRGETGYSTLAKLEAELLQVAAVAVQVVENIRRCRAKRDELAASHWFLAYRDDQ